MARSLLAYRKPASYIFVSWQMVGIVCVWIVILPLKSSEIFEILNRRIALGQQWWPNQWCVRKVIEKLYLDDDDDYKVWSVLARSLRCDCSEALGRTGGVGGLWLISHVRILILITITMMMMMVTPIMMMTMTSIWTTSPKHYHNSKRYLVEFL